MLKYMTFKQYQSHIELAGGSSQPRVTKVHSAYFFLLMQFTFRNLRNRPKNLVTRACKYMELCTIMNGTVFHWEFVLYRLWIQTVMISKFYCLIPNFDITF